MATPFYEYPQPVHSERQPGSLAKLLLVPDNPLEDIDSSNTQLTKIDRTIKVNGVTAHYTVTTSMSCPDLEGSAPIQVLPGHFGAERCYSAFSEELAGLGTTAITFGLPRHQGIASVRPRNVLHPDKLLSEISEAVAMDAQQEFGIGGVHVLGHSFGGKGAVEHVENSQKSHSGPEVLSMTLLDSTGSTKHNSLTLTGRSLLVAKDLAALAIHDPKIIRDGLAYGLTNPPRTVGESIVGSNARLKPSQMQRIGKSGVKTIMINHAGDQLFPAQDVPEALINSFDDYHVGMPKDGGHLAVSLQPRSVALDINDSLKRAGF